LSDFTVAPPATRFYHEFLPFTQQQPSDKQWWDLLGELLKSLESPKGALVAIIVDALDEMSSELEAHKFLQGMGEIMDSHSHIYFLCSSREHIDMGKMGCSVPQYHMNSEDTKDDMKSFITNEIESRKQNPAANDSVFCM
jgi:hypothetical protein